MANSPSGSSYHHLPRFTERDLDEALQVFPPDELAGFLPAGDSDSRGDLFPEPSSSALDELGEWGGFLPGSV